VASGPLHQRGYGLVEGYLPVQQGGGHFPDRHLHAVGVISPSSRLINTGMEVASRQAEPPDVAILAMTRTYHAGDTPVETADIIMAGHRNLLAYRLAVN
jgi:hypothetical protein